MSKVLVFGTFDLFHKGHEFFLNEAKKYGDELHVVIALDETVEAVKGQLPVNSQDTRKEEVFASNIVNYVYLGNTGDKYKIIEDINPNIIVLGYDQSYFVEGLHEELLQRGLNVEVVALKEGFEVNKYKSSILREQLQ